VENLLENKKNVNQWVSQDCSYLIFFGLLDRKKKVPAKPRQGRNAPIINQLNTPKLFLSLSALRVKGVNKI